MDITLERILSLIPRKEDGKFVHGAFKQFGESIGYDGGEIVTMWIKGSSESYKKKLHEIADKYDVSVEWLQGYTDVKEKPTAGAVGMSAAEAGRYAVEHADSEDELWQLISRAQERIREMNGKKQNRPQM